MVNDSLRVAAEEISLESAARCVAEHYGIEGEASALTSERDKNFKITALDGREYAFKVSNPAEDPQVNDFQVNALRHIQQLNPALPVPRVIHALNGDAHLRLPFAEGGLCSARLLTFLPGVMIHGVVRSSALRRNLGALLAQLGQALSGFSHPAAGHELAWDLKNTSQVTELLEHIDGTAGRALATHFLDNFERHAKPHLPMLRSQVVHNDLNLHNVLVNVDTHHTVQGVLDFGDMVHTNLICDVAVGASYHVVEEQIGGGDPWDRVIEFVVAYHSVAPLLPKELDLLYDLIAARFVITVAITGWRAVRYPENAAYILKNNVRSWQGLSCLLDLPREQAQSRLRSACTMEQKS